MKLIFKLIFFLVIFFFNFSDDEAIALCSDVDPNDSPLTISCDTSGGNLTIDSFDATLSNGQTLAITNEDDGHIIIDNGGNFSYDGKNSITSTSGTVTVLLEGKGNGGFYFYEDLNFSGSLQISDALARVGRGMTSNIDVDIGSGATLYVDYDSVTINMGSLTGSGILSNYHRHTLDITNSGNNSFSGSLNQNHGGFNNLSSPVMGSINFGGSGTLTISGTSSDTQQSIQISNSLILSISSSSNLGEADNNAVDSDKIIFNGGTLNTTSTFTLDDKFGITLTGNGTIDTQTSTTLSYSGIITGSGNFTKTGSGSLTLSGVNSYTGTTTISGGTLSISGSGSLNSGNYNKTITNSGTFDFASSATQTLSGIISGTGDLSKTGSGSLTLSGTNTYTGKTTISGGTLSISASAGLGATPASADADNITFNGGTLGTTATFTLGTNKGITLTGAGTISPNSSTTLTYAGVITGTGNLTKAGAGDLVLSGTNLYTGRTLINAGTLSISASANLGATPASADADNITFNGGTLASTARFTLGTNKGITLTGAGTIDVATSTELTYAGIITGSGAFTKSGDGQLTLTGVNTYTGASTISAGTLRIGNNRGLGTAAGNTSVSSGATLDVNNSSGSEYTLSENIVGAGSLNKTGSGDIRLTGDNSISGALNVNEGTLLLGSSTIAQDLNVLSASNAGDVTISDGATLNLSAHDIFGALGHADSRRRDLIVNGTLIGSDGSFNALGDITLDTGTVTLGTNISSNDMNMTLDGDITVQNGTSTINGSGNLGIGAGASNQTVTVTVNTGSQLNINANLINGNSSWLTDNTGNLTKAGAGNLTLNGTNTYTGATTISAGTLEIGGAGTLGSGSYAGSISNSGTLDFASSATQTFSGAISGTGNLTVSGSGSLTLSGTNTATGNISVSSGTLNLSGTNSTSGTVTVSGGLLNITGGNTYTGSTTISGGTLRFRNFGDIGGSLATDDTDNIILSGGTLDYVGSTTLNLDAEKGIRLTANSTINIEDSAGSLRFRQSINQSTTGITLTKTGDGNLRFISFDDTDSDFNGTVNVSDGTFQVVDGSGGINPWADFDVTIANGAGMRVNNSAMEAGTTITVNDGGTVILRNQTSDLRTFSSDFSISGDGNSTYSSNANDQAAIVVDLSADDSADNIIRGTVTLTGDSSILITDIDNDTLNTSAYLGFGDATDNSRTAVALGANTLTLKAVSGGSARSYTISDQVTGTGTLTVESGAFLYMTRYGFSSADMFDNGDFADTVNLNISGRLYISKNDTIASLQGSGGVYINNSANLTVSNTSGSTTFSGVIQNNSGSASLTKAGNSTLVLSGANTYTGTTTITAGTLTVTGSLSDSTAVNVTGTYDVDASDTIASIEGSGNIELASGITLTAGDSNDKTFSGVASGSGSFVKAGTGTLTLSGTNTYSGATTISAGTLEIGGSGVLGNGSYAGNISNSGTLDFASSATQTLSGIISGTGGLSKTGSGSLTLSGTNTYTGKTIISGGTLSISASAGLGATPASADADNIDFDNNAILNASSSFTLGTNKGITMTGAGTFDVDDSVTLTYGGSITGSGNITKTGSGTLLLSGASQSASGDFTVSGGTLSLGKQSAFNYAHTSGLSITLNSGSTLTTSGNFFNRLNDLTINNATLTSTGGDVTSFSGKTLAYQLHGTVTASGTSTISNNDITLGYNGSGTTFNVASGGTLTASSNLLNSNSTTWGSYTTSALTKSGTGTLVLSGTNEYTGTTTISAGTLRATNTSALGTTAGGTTVASGSTLELYNTGSEYTVSEAITISGDGVSSGGALQSTGLIEIDSAITLNANSKIVTNSGSTLTISGSSGINGSSGNYNLTLGGAGNMTISAPINLGTGALTKSVGGTLSITGALTVGSLIDGSRASISADVSTSGVQTYQAGADLTGDITITASTLTVGDGDATDTIIGNGNDLTVTGILDLNAAASTFDGISVSGASNLGANVTSSGTQTYTGAVTLSGGDRTLTGSIINFGSTLAGGSNSLTITGGLDLDGAATGLTNLSVSGTSNVGANVTSTGTQTYTGATTISNSVTLQGSTVNFVSTLTGSGSENLTITGNTDIDGAVTNIADLSVSGTSNIGANVTSSGTQTYTGAVTISGSADTIQLSASTVNFESTVAGGTKNLQVSGAADIDGVITGVNNLVVTGNTDIGANITTSGNQNYSTGTTTFSATSTLTAGTVFLGNVTGSTNNITITGNLTLTGNIASGNELTVSGASALSGNVTTTGFQSYQGNTTLGANNTFITSNSNIGFSGTLNSSNSTARNITANVGTGDVIFGGAVGGTNAVGTIAITGGLDLNAAISSATSVSVSGAANLGANVTTTGTQAYNGTNTLSNDVVLTTTNSNITLNTTDSDSTSRDLTASIGTGTLNITGTVGATNAIDEINVTGNLDLDSTINASSLSVSGTTDLSNNVTTSGTQTYTGATTISQNATLTATSVSVGTVTASSKNLTVTGNLITTGNISGVSILSVSGASTIGGNITTNSNQSYTGNIALNSATTLQGQRITATSIDNSGNNLTVNTSSASTAVTGVISGSGGLIKAGSGTLTLSADSTYSGDTTLNAGTVVITSAGSIVSDTIALNNSSVLDLKGTDVLSAGATVTVGSSAQLHVRQNNTIGTAAGSGIIRIRDNRNLTVENNSFTGTIKGEGNLVVQGSFVLGGSGQASLGDTNDSTLNNVNTIISGSGNALTLGAANTLISGNDLTIQNSGTVNIAGFSQTVSTIDAAGTISGGTDSSSITATTAINLKSGELTSGTNIDGSVALSKSTTGTFELKGKAKHTGNTNVTAGILDVTGSIEDTDTVNVSGGTLKLRNASALHSNADISVSSGTLEVKENTQVRDFAASGGTTQIDAGKQLTINPTTNNQQVTGLTGSGTFKKTGSSTTILTGTNNFSGKTQITAGTLRVDGTLSSNTDVAVESGATLDVRNNVTVNTIEDAGDITTTTGNKFTISDNASKTFSGKLRGAGNYEKSGSGTLTLTGESDTSGSVIVSGGVLYAGTAASSSTTVIANTVTVNSGGILGGGGRVGGVTSSGGTLAPGNSIGTLYVDGNLELDSSSNTQIEFNTSASDKIVVTGDITVAGTITLKPENATYAATSLVIIDGSSDTSQNFSGSFSTVTVDTSSNLNGATTSLTYDSSLQQVILNITASTSSSDSSVASKTTNSSLKNVASIFDNATASKLQDLKTYWVSANVAVVDSELKEVKGTVLASTLLQTQKTHNTFQKALTNVTAMGATSTVGNITRSSGSNLTLAQLQEAGLFKDKNNWSEHWDYSDQSVLGFLKKNKNKTLLSGNKSKDRAAFLRTYGGKTKRNNIGSTFTGYNNDTYGLLFGEQIRVASNIFHGYSYGFSGSDTDYNDNFGESNTYSGHASIFKQIDSEKNNINLIAGSYISNTKSTRNVSVGSGLSAVNDTYKSEMTDIGINATAQYTQKLKLGSWNFSPTVSLQGSYEIKDDTNESGGDLALHIKNDDLFAMRPEIGLSLDKDFSKLEEQTNQFNFSVFASQDHYLDGTKSTANYASDSTTFQLKTPRDQETYISTGFGYNYVNDINKTNLIANAFYTENTDNDLKSNIISVTYRKIFGDFDKEGLPPVVAEKIEEEESIIDKTIKTVKKSLVFKKPSCRDGMTYRAFECVPDEKTLQLVASKLNELNKREPTLRDKFLNFYIQVSYYLPFITFIMFIILVYEILRGFIVSQFKLQNNKVVINKKRPAFISFIKSYFNKHFEYI